MADQDIKGEMVLITAGNLYGKTVWLDKRSDPTKKRVFVILEEPGKKREYHSVNRTSIGPLPEEPTTYAHAAFQQHPDMRRVLDQLCVLMASCNIYSNDENVAEIVYEGLRKREDKLIRMGNRAVYREVHWEEPARREREPARREQIELLE